MAVLCCAAEDLLAVRQAVSKQLKQLTGNLEMAIQTMTHNQQQQQQQQNGAAAAVATKCASPPRGARLNASPRKASRMHALVSGGVDVADGSSGGRGRQQWQDDDTSHQHDVGAGVSTRTAAAAAAVGVRAHSSSTSHAPVSAFQQAFEGLLAQGFDILCLTISSRLSGAYSSASVAARETDEGRIAVVDSQTTCGGLWLLCKAARGLADAGLGLSDLALRVKELRPKAGIVFSVENMDALRRSGRLGVIPQSVGTLLNIRPILQCQNGSVASVGVARGLQDRVRQMLRRIPEKPVALMLHYLLPAPTADALRQAIEQKFEGVPLYTAIGGPVLGIHLGAGTIGVSWITE